MDGCRYLVTERLGGNEVTWIPIELADRPIQYWDKFLSATTKRVLKGDSFIKDLRRIAWVCKVCYHEKPVLRAWRYIAHYRLEYDWPTHLQPILDALEYFYVSDIEIWPDRLDPASLEPEALKKYRQFLIADSQMRLYTMALLDPDEAMPLLDDWFHSGNDVTLGLFENLGKVPLRIRAKMGGKRTWRHHPSKEKITDLYDQYRARFPNETKIQLARRMLEKELRGRYLNASGECGKPESLAKRFPSK